MELIDINDYPEHDRTLYQTLQEMNTRQKNGTADYSFPHFNDHSRWHKETCCYAFALHAQEYPKLQPGALALHDRENTAKHKEVRDLYKRFLDIMPYRSEFPSFADSITKLIELDGLKPIGHTPESIENITNEWIVAVFLAQRGDIVKAGYALPHHDFHFIAMRRHEENIVMAQKTPTSTQNIVMQADSLSGIFQHAAHVRYNHFAGYYRFDPVNHVSRTGKTIIDAAQPALA